MSAECRVLPLEPERWVDQSDDEDEQCEAQRARGDPPAAAIRPPAGVGRPARAHRTGRRRPVPASASRRPGARTTACTCLSESLNGGSIAQIVLTEG
jgi:hypothetical protein